MSPSTTLWYFADPMCSWCWGFTSIMESIKSVYERRFNIALMLGGLRPGTTEPVTEQFRDEILQHWHHVQKRTGQVFTFPGAMPDGFIYDTEPACRAVVTVAHYNSDRVFQYFKSIQTAFYIDQIDVTRLDNLAELASKHGVALDQFHQYFPSDEARQKTMYHFQATRQAGVTGFPSLVLQKETDYQFIARGYCPLDELVVLIEKWLRDSEV